MIRYFANTLISMILFCVIFYVFFKGYTILASSPLNYGTTVPAMVVAYYCWTMMMSIYTTAGYMIEQNKDTGVIENIIVKTKHYISLIISESIADTVITFILSWLIIIILAWITSVSLHFYFFDVFVVMIVGLISILGLSLFVAGLTVVFRKALSIMSIIQFLLLGSLFLPAIPLVKLFVPFRAANEMLLYIFRDGARFFSFSAIDYSCLLFNSIVYMVLGIVVFNQSLNYAKIKGTLGFY